MQRRTAAVDRPLTYRAPADWDLHVGDVVHVPLGPQRVYAFVVCEPYALPESGPVLRDVVARADGPPAFDARGLELARWMAEHYCCTLGEALASVTFAPSIPRVVDRFTVGALPSPAKLPSVPPRLLRLLAGDLAGGFTLPALLRHPEARRAGDRGTLLRAVSTLVRAGALVRERTLQGGRTREVREKVLETTGVSLAGPRVQALLQAVNAAGVMRRSDAILAGFSPALIARAVRAGALRESLRTPDRAAPRAPGGDLQLTATDEQARAIETIAASAVEDAFGEVLLQGITGSGKTFVYIAALARTIAAGGRGIVLVPEISLTPQTARRFEAVFGSRVAVLHSALGERERFDAWRLAARGDVDVVVGARSALFAPLPDVRLVIIDEAHERTYKQDGAPRYNALDVAREMMRAAGGTLVYGSATPPLEVYERALRGELTHVRLNARATNAALPAVHVVDLAREFADGNRRIFSGALTAALGACLERGDKAVLFVNRRGSASFLLCRSCGAVPECDRCSVSLVAHRSEGLLRCHFCDRQRPIPAQCPACGLPTVREFGVGTQKVAQTVNELFADARVVRMDSDTTTRVGDHARLLDEFAQRGDVLVGTQMIAKGLDFPSVTLVGAVAADIGLHAPDFRSAERTFDVLTQVAGRSGRNRPGEAIVQTYTPAHPAIAFAARHDFDGFAAHELAQRRQLGYPPFGELLYVGVVGARLGDVREIAAACAQELALAPGAEVLGPAPLAVARVNGEWRYRIAVKSADGAAVRRIVRERVLPAAAKERRARVIVNVDP